MSQDNKVKRAVYSCLKTFEDTRASDPMLIYRVFYGLGYPRDLREIAERFDEDIFGSITRYRRYYQALYPSLRPAEQITAQRRARQEEKEREFGNDEKE